MTHDDAKRLVKKLAGLFPGQVTQELARLAVKRFREFDAKDVERAVEQHRETGGTKDGFIDWKNLFEGCRAATHAREQVTDNSHKEGSWFDVYRRQRPQLEGRSDAEVALRVHRDWWFRCGRSLSYRVQFHSSCVNQLVNTGMAEETAKQWAAAAFDESPDYFRECLDELRNPRGAVA